MNNEINKIFSNIGLNETETELYIKALNFGALTAIELAKECRISRQMVYRVVAVLESKGLIKGITIGKRHYFRAVDPEVLLDVVEQTKNELKMVLPEIKSQSVSDRVIPIVTVYDNISAMREWYRKVLKEARKGDEMLIWSVGSDWQNLDADFYRKYLNKKKKIGIKERVLKPDTVESREQYKNAKRRGVEWRFYAEGWGNGVEKIIWQDEVSYLTVGKTAANLILINSKELASQERWDFENSWQKCRC